jgi:hypothetical protein
MAELGAPAFVSRYETRHDDPSSTSCSTSPAAPGSVSRSHTSGM